MEASLLRRTVSKEVSFFLRTYWWKKNSGLMKLFS
jgi:hypothetical protein